jgi:hypothetical protein
MLVPVTAAANPPYVAIYQAMPSRSMLAQPVLELRKIAWMVGKWRCHIRSFAVGSTPARDFGESTYTARFIMRNALNGEKTWLQLADDATHDLSFITYDPMAKQWVVTGIEWPVSYGVSTGQLTGDSLVATGDSTIFGRKYRLRQSYTRLSDDAFKITNEEQRPDGSWIADDEYDFVRSKSKILAHRRRR